MVSQSHGLKPVPPKRKLLVRLALIQVDHGAHEGFFGGSDVAALDGLHCHGDFLSVGGFALGREESLGFGEVGEGGMAGDGLSFEAHDGFFNHTRGGRDLPSGVDTGVGLGTVARCIGSEFHDEIHVNDLGSAGD